MEIREQLRIKLQTIEEKIEEIKNRLPAHSIQPGMMMELMDLEDERDRLSSRINRIEHGY